MAKIKILITAGPTREKLDPVRFLSNLSTGEMGYALARMAKARQYSVTLISGPVSLKPPSGVRFIPIESARDLQKACATEFSKNQILIMTAAVCDFTAASFHSEKIQRTKTKQLKLRQTPDIVAGLAKRKGKRIVIGFCLETSQWIKKGRQKLMHKRLDGMVANYYTRQHVPFGNVRLNTAFLGPGGYIRKLYSQNKRQIAEKLLVWVESLRRSEKY